MGPWEWGVPRDGGGQGRRGVRGTKGWGQGTRVVLGMPGVVRDTGWCWDWGCGGGTGTGFVGWHRGSRGSPVSGAVPRGQTAPGQGGPPRPSVSPQRPSTMRPCLLLALALLGTASARHLGECPRGAAGTPEGAVGTPAVTPAAVPSRRPLQGGRAGAGAGARAGAGGRGRGRGVPAGGRDGGAEHHGAAERPHLPLHHRAALPELPHRAGGQGWGTAPGVPLPPGPGAAP